MTLGIIFLVTLALIVPGAPTTESDELLKSLLELEGMVLSPKMWEYRKKIFEASWLAKEENETMSLESTYTFKELDQQRGGNLITRDVEVDILEENVTNWKDLTTPEFFDPRQINVTQEDGTIVTMVNKVVNQQTCGNCYLHSFVAAFEIAFVRATGKRVKFSEQEMTDCYFKGCDGGDYRMVTVLMSYIDKLSSKENYGPYLAGKYTCRQSTTPNNLGQVKVKGFVTVKPENVQAAIMSFGSVMTCMDWGISDGDRCRMDNYNAGSIVDYPEEKEKCRHSVVIVGYTSEFYIVRNSHGVTWGDKGYFYIKRGTNSCGIEGHMNAIVVEIRDHKKKKVSNKDGCPADKPKFCKPINTCVETGKSCVNKIDGVFTKENNKNMDIYKNRGKLSGPSFGNLLAHRRMEVRKNERSCKDKHSRCKFLEELYGCEHLITMEFCKNTCNNCPAEEEVEIRKIDLENRGFCFKPMISNGRVRNSPIMKSGEKLKVECNDGYTLTGKPVTCLIQNVFTNDDKDARLLPECIKLGSEDLVGNGATYTGSKNTYIDKNQREIRCENWNKDALEGILMGYKEGNKFKLGNHNYCRNPQGAAPVPMCLTRDPESEGDNTFPVFCFEHPGCDTCEGMASDHYPTDYCEKQRSEGNCAYRATESLELAKFMWINCQATCCARYCK